MYLSLPSRPHSPASRAKGFLEAISGGWLSVRQLHLWCCCCLLLLGCLGGRLLGGQGKQPVLRSPSPSLSPRSRPAPPALPCAALRCSSRTHTLSLSPGDPPPLLPDCRAGFSSHVARETWVASVAAEREDPSTFPRSSFAGHPHQHAHRHQASQHGMSRRSS